MFSAFATEYKASIQGEAHRFYIFSCAKAFNFVDFEVKMRQLESSAQGIRAELESIGFEKWYYAFSPCRKYKLMTTNMLESLNSTIPNARDLPICLMLEVLRMMTQQWFYDRRNEAEFQVIEFTKAIKIHLREQIDKGIDASKFLVHILQYITNISM